MSWPPGAVLKRNGEKPRERGSQAGLSGPAHPPSTAGLHRCAASPVNGARSDGLPRYEQHMRYELQAPYSPASEETSRIPQCAPTSSLVPSAAPDYRGACLEAPKGESMRRTSTFAALYAILLALAAPAAGDAACCYFSAKNADILQPAQKVFISWDPVKKIETFTVQPKFEGNALDFGMVIPTPSQPKLHEMPRDFFKHLAVYTIMKKREMPQSKMLVLLEPRVYAKPLAPGGVAGVYYSLPGQATRSAAPPQIKILEAGVVGSLDYKIIEASRADDLFQWLKDNKYSYAGDEASLNFYIQKKWLFTVMKIDTMQMKRNKDGTFAGEVTPTRFQFASDKLIYPLKITQI